MGVKSDHRGFYEWIVQRVSAVMIGAYTVFLFAFFLTHAPMTFVTWSGLYSHLLMKISTILVLIAVLWHAWIGLWTVFTDYVKNGAVRLLLEVLLVITLLGFMVWCLSIIR